MKLSKPTLDIFKNFAGINSNLLLKTGSKIATISSGKSVMASSTIAESFPNDFGIYDLNQFLAAMSLFDDPELEFTDKFVSIKQGTSGGIKFYAAEASVLTTPQKEITFPDADIEFKFTTQSYGLIMRTASVLGSPDLSIVGDGSKIVGVVGDKKNATANTYEVDFGATDKKFKVNLKIENLKMIPGEYNVSISSKRISRFAGAGDLVYFVAVESDSSFE